jgi:hypothetical protein
MSAQLAAADPLLAPYRAALSAEAPAPARVCYAAAHVAMLPGYAETGHRPDRPGSAGEIAALIDWETTMALRAGLDEHGFGIAEAMDTAQRFEIGWPAARELIARTGALGLRHGFVAGAGTDHLDRIGSRNDLVDGVVHQARVIQQHGGLPVILPMPWLCAQRATEQEFVDVYKAIADRLAGPLLVHWLGPMFLPALQGYFPGESFWRVMALDPAVVRGCKLSLLDAEFELRVRRELLKRDQIVLTGDDFHFGRLLLGGDPAGPPPATPPPVLRYGRLGRQRLPLGDFSHALLGVLDAIALPAGLALRLLAQGDAARFLALMTPCEALGQHLFAPPTAHYKAGLAFLAWLDGRQPNPMLPNRAELLRDRGHYLRAAELAAACGAIRDALGAQQRLRRLLEERP